MTSCIAQKDVEQRVRSHETLLMCDGFRDLYRESEIRRDARGPFLVRGGAMQVIEGRVDLDGGEPGSVALEQRALCRERCLISLGNRPAGATDAIREHARCLCKARTDFAVTL